MGTYQSSLIRGDDDDIAVYLQRDHCTCGGSTLYQICGISPSSGNSVFSEPARFNEAKPFDLKASDDVWASLKLRVDPLARKIFDPYRAYYSAALLCLLVCVVFASVRPGSDLKSDWDDDYNDNSGGNNGDDVALAAWSYFNADPRMLKSMKLWRMSFCAVIVLVVLSTFAIGIAMELQNSRVDSEIVAVCTEIQPRFEQEGYSIEYRTKSAVSGFFSGHFRPERVMIFRIISSNSFVSHTIGPKGEYLKGNTYSPPPATPIHDTDPEEEREKSLVSQTADRRFGALTVTVPPGGKPGRSVSVATPSGQSILVAIPNGVRPGETFSVQIPSQMLRSQT